MSELNLEIISAKGPVFKGQCHMAIVPSINGEIGFMNNHESIMTRLKKGQIIIQDEKQSTIKEVDVDSGYAEMCNNKLIVLLD